MVVILCPVLFKHFPFPLIIRLYSRRFPYSYHFYSKVNLKFIRYFVNSEKLLLNDRQKSYFHYLLLNLPSYLTEFRDLRYEHHPMTETVNQVIVQLPKVELPNDFTFVDKFCSQFKF